MKLRYLAPAAAALVLAACSGTSGVSPNSAVGYVPSPAPGASLSPQAVNVTVSVPISAQTKHVSHAYLSPNTQSLTLQLTAVNGTAIPSQPATTVNTYAGASNCTASSGALTCTGTVTGAVGNDVFSVTAYAQPNSTGSVLSAGTFAAEINTSQNSLSINNNVSLTLSGIIASISMTVSAASIPIGTPTSAPVIINATDPSGAVIVGPGPYSSPIVVSITNGTSDFGLVSGSNTTPQNTITLTSPTSSLLLAYDGNAAAAPGAVSLQAQTQGPSGQLTTNASVQVLPAASSSPPPGPGTIYVLNAGNNGGTGATVTEYSTTANGNSAPVRTLALSSSLYAVGFAVDASGAVYVGYYDNASFTVDGGNEIDVYAPGASGNAAPSRRVMSDPVSQTFLDPGVIALDATNRIVTIVDTQLDTQAGLPAVGIYPAGANGAIAPTHAWNFDYTLGPYINGYNSGGQGYVGALAVDGGENFYVAGALYNLNVFGGVFTAGAAAASGGVVPIARTIPAGPTTTIPPPPDVISGLALDGSGFIYVSSTTVPGGVGPGAPVTGAIDVFSPGASGGTTQTPPVRAITGTQLNSTLPQSAIEPLLPIAVYGNTLFVANQGQNNVAAFATTATGSAPPSATISGSSTGLSTPVAIAVSSGTQVSTAHARLEKHPHP